MLFGTRSKVVLAGYHQFDLGYRYLADRPDQLEKLVEKVFRIMGSRTCLWMVLYRKDIFVFHSDSGHGMIV